MSNSKISALTSATTPLSGSEIVPINQSGVTDSVTVANLTAGRAVSAASLSLTTTPLSGANGGTGLTSFTSGGLVYASSTSALATGSGLIFDGSNLGLGLTPSAWSRKAFEISCGGSAGYIAGNNGTIVISNNSHYNSGDFYTNTNYATYYAQNPANGQHAWAVAPSGTAGNAISFTQAMTLDNNGNLMVGQTSATGKLSVTGTGSSNTGVLAVNATDTSSTFVWAQQSFLSGITSGQNLISMIGKSGSTLNAGYVGYKFSSSGSTSNILTFGHYGADNLMNLDGNGNLLVGTTTSPSGSGNIVAPTIYSSTTASVSYVAVSSSGLLQRGGVSAAKYKQDIRDLEPINIDKFRPVRYKSKCETDDQTIDHFGFIADDFDKDGLKELVIYDKNGEVEGFAYDKLTAVLTKELQSLRFRVAQLEAQKG